jgi:CHRD domain-containing protein
MRGLRGAVNHSLWLGVGGAGLLVACAAGPAVAEPVVLSGSTEVPPVTTQASGIADVSIVYIKCAGAGFGGHGSGDCPTAVGTVTTGGVAVTAVHIHQAAAGQNGPVVVSLKPRPDNNAIWDVPPGATVSQAVYEAFWNGQLYVNVHSAANPGGEIRAQLRR